MDSAKPLSTGPFVGVSYADQRTEFAKWVKSGKRADHHAAVRPPEVSTPLSDEIVIIGEVELRQSYEDKSSWFHCNACNTKAKFKNGGFCAAVGDGYWYIVGPDCGNEEYQRLLNRGLLQYSAELTKTSLEQRIGKFHARFHDWVRGYELAGGAAREAMQLRQEMWKVERFRSDMVSARKNGGRLTVRSLKKDDDMEC